MAEEIKKEQLFPKPEELVKAENAFEEFLNDNLSVKRRKEYDLLKEKKDSLFLKDFKNIVKSCKSDALFLIYSEEDEKQVEFIKKVKEEAEKAGIAIDNFSSLFEKLK